MPEHTPLPLAQKTGGCCGGGGGCGCGHAAEVPELDARTIPHAIRHGAILGALSQVQPGESMILVAPHDPLPLLAQVDQLLGDTVRRTYLAQGPDAWRLRFDKVA